MIKNVYFRFRTKTHYSVILDYRGVGKRFVWGGIGGIRGERRLNKLNQEKLLKYCNMWMMLFWGHSFVKIK